MEQPKGRRRFLKSSVGALGVAAACPATVVSTPASGAEAHAHPGNAKADKYMFFSAAKVAFVDAAVARLIPADELGPGAKEAGVTYFIDQQLFGGWGTMAKMYRQGPHAEGTPQQGYQSPLTPQEIFRVAIREINSSSRQALRKARGERAGRGPEEPRGRQAGAGRRAVALFLQHAPRQHDRGLLLRSDLRRQPRQGRLEAGRLPGRRGGVHHAHRQARRRLQRRAGVDRRHARRPRLRRRARPSEARDAHAKGLTWPPDSSRSTP